jgi:hypothetical protein
LTTSGSLRKAKSFSTPYWPLYVRSTPKLSKPSDPVRGTLVNRTKHPARLISSSMAAVFFFD